MKGGTASQKLSEMEDMRQIGIRAETGSLEATDKPKMSQHVLFSEEVVVSVTL